MKEHPIDGLISTALEKIRQMIDVNTIVGEPVKTDDGTIIIPISKVSLGFGAGGSDFGSKPIDVEKNNFGGGAGAGVSLSPVAFLVVGQGQIKLLPINIGTTAVDKVLDYIPSVIDKVNSLITKKEKEPKDEE